MKHQKIILTEDEDVPRFKVLRNHNVESRFHLKENQVITGSGKFAIASILAHLRKSGVIQDKSMELFVPKWMGQWVYRSMLGSVLPATQISKQTACIYVYHQFGFLQEIEYLKEFARSKGIPIIEDSAHLLNFQNSNLQNAFLGDYNVSSPSKFINIPPISIVETSDPIFIKQVEERKNQERKVYSQTVLMGRFLLDSTLVAQTSSIFREKVADLLYASYLTTSRASELAVKRLSTLENEYVIRLHRTNLLYRNIPNEYLPSRDLKQMYIAPLKVPIFPPKKISQSILSEKQFSKFLIQFDRNRNMLDPNYVSAFAFPMHSGIPESQFLQRITEFSKCL